MPLQHCGHKGAHVCWVCWFCGKAQTQFADIQTVFTHRVVFIIFNKIENPASWNAVCNLFLEIGWNTSNLSCMENKPWVAQSYGDGCDCLMKGAKIYMIICGAAGRLLWMKIWCFDLKRRLEKTNDSPLRHFPCISLKFHCHCFTKLCLINLSFGNCVDAVCWRCLPKDTNWNCRPVHWTFWHNAVRKAKIS